MPQPLLLISKYRHRSDSPPRNFHWAVQGSKGYIEGYREIQRKVYPDLRALELNRPAHEVFKAAVSLGKSLGWEIVAEDMEAGTSEWVNSVRGYFVFKTTFRCGLPGVMTKLTLISVHEILG